MPSPLLSLTCDDVAGGGAIGVITDAVLMINNGAGVFSAATGMSNDFSDNKPIVGVRHLFLSTDHAPLPSLHASRLHPSLLHPSLHPSHLHTIRAG